MMGVKATYNIVHVLISPNRLVLLHQCYNHLHADHLPCCFYSVSATTIYTLITYHVGFTPPVLQPPTCPSPNKLVLLRQCCSHLHAHYLTCWFYSASAAATYMLITYQTDQDKAGCFYSASASAIYSQCYIQKSCPRLGFRRGIPQSANLCAHVCRAISHNYFVRTYKHT